MKKGSDADALQAVTGRMTELAQRLARAIAADVDARREADELHQLVTSIGDEPDRAVLETLFATLRRELRAVGATLPPPEALPHGLAALLAAADGALTPGPDGLDFEAAADRLDQVIGAHTGRSPRQQRDDALRDRIRREVSASVAASLRRQGLTPASDLDDD